MLAARRSPSVASACGRRRARAARRRPCCGAASSTRLAARQRRAPASPSGVSCSERTSRGSPRARPWRRRRAPSGVACSVVMRLVSEVNGISSTRGLRGVERRPVAGRPWRRRRPARLRSDRPGSPARRPRSSRPGGRRRRGRRRAAARAALATAATARRRRAGTRPRARSRCRRRRSARPATKTRRTVISSLVSVPVLSEQMTEVLPSVSTAGRRRTRALRLTMRCTPMRQRDGDHGGQRLGHDGDGQRDAEDQHLQEGLRRAAGRARR